jgi:hypothetical protein
MITIPEHFWSSMLEAFAKEHRQVEQVCYFDGIVEAGGDGVVTTLTIPNAQLHRQRFEVSPPAMSQAGKHFRVYRLKRLAQVHTHPTEWTAHSPWDDQKAYSQLSGAVSIVLPHFARGRPGLSEAGVHVRTVVGWQSLSPAEVATRLRVIPSVLDFRPQIRSKYAEPDRRNSIEPSRGRHWWKAFLFWRC